MKGYIRSLLSVFAIVLSVSIITPSPVSAAVATNTSLRYVLTNSSGSTYVNSSGTSFSFDNLAECQQTASGLAGSGVAVICRDSQVSGSGGTCSGASSNQPGACRARCDAASEHSDGTCRAESGAAYVGNSCCVANTGATAAGACINASNVAGYCYTVCPTGYAGTARANCSSAGDICCTAATAATAAGTAAANTGAGAGAGAGAMSAVAFTNPLAFDTVQGATAVFLDAFQQIIVWLALLFIVLGGIFYITSAGDEKRIGTAKKMITAALIGLAIGVAAPSFLKVIGDVLGWGEAEVPTSVADAKSAVEIVQDILNFLLGITGLLAIIMFVIGGFMFFAAAGDEKRAETAKSIIKYSVIGVAVVILSLIIIRTVAGLFS
ncbi:MAG TPA: pilin [Candidatus Fimivivens sp.]|nr:pilin [Candidatus Fimivivens sp.]